MTDEQKLRHAALVVLAGRSRLSEEEIHNAVHQCGRHLFPDVDSTRVALDLAHDINKANESWTKALTFLKAVR